MSSGVSVRWWCGVTTTKYTSNPGVLCPWPRGVPAPSLPLDFSPMSGFIISDSLAWLKQPGPGGWRDTRR